MDEPEITRVTPSKIKGFYLLNGGLAVPRHRKILGVQGIGVIVSFQACRRNCHRSPSLTSRRTRVGSAVTSRPVPVAR